MTLLTNRELEAPGAVVLAAGRSSRMGRPKALLEIDSQTFLGLWLEKLAEAEIHSVCVVLGPDGDAIEEQFGLPPGLAARNPEPEKGMLSSLIVGLSNLPDAVAGAFLCPVDHPSVTVEDLVALRDAVEPGRIVLPVHGGRRGHPALFGRKWFDELRRTPLELGARAVVRAHPGSITEVEAGPGILVDIDTPEDYRSLS